MRFLRHTILTGLSAAALLAGAPTAAGALTATSSATASDDDAPSLRATLEECETGLGEEDRVAEFRGAMPARSGHRLLMRFDLERRDADGEDFERTKAPTFGRWERSKAGVAGFVYRKRVEGLEAPGQYRAVVRFRWKSRAGRTLRTSKRTTKICRIRDERPNLTVTDVRLVATAFGPVLAVDVENDGRTGTRRESEVALRAGGVEIAAARVPELEADESGTVLVAAVGCTAADAEIVVDPDDVVDEADEDDNRRVRPCA